MKTNCPLAFYECRPHQRMMLWQIAFLCDLLSVLKRRQISFWCLFLLLFLLVLFFFFSCSLYIRHLNHFQSTTPRFHKWGREKRIHQRGTNIEDGCWLQFANNEIESLTHNFKKCANVWQFFFLKDEQKNETN